MSDKTHVADMGDQVVLLPVPRRYYPTVVRALADAMTAGEPSPEVALKVDEEPNDDASGPHQQWTRDEVRRLKEVVRNPSVRALLDLTSERPGEWVSIRDVEKRANRTFHQTRADLGGFTKTVKRMFGLSLIDHSTKWPFEAAWAVDGEQHLSYRVSEEVARWWREA